MRSLQLIALSGLLCFLLPACFYEPFPLSEKGTAPTDESLPGLWVDRQHGICVKVISKKRDCYDILVYFNDSNPAPVEFSAFPSKIGNENFLNVRTVKSNDVLIPPAKWKVYFIWRYTKSNHGNVLKIYDLNANFIPEGIDTSEGLRAFISSHVHSRSLFERKALILRRL